MTGSHGSLPRGTPSSHPSPGWSESIQTVLAQPVAALPRYLLMSGMAFTVAFSLWAWKGHIQEVSQATGELIPKGETYKIQPAISGEIEKILVTEGDRVRKGQLLFEFDSVLLNGEIMRLQQTLDAAEQKLAQVNSILAAARHESAIQQHIATVAVTAHQAGWQQHQAQQQTYQTLLSELEEEMQAHQERLGRLSRLEAAGAISREHLFEVEQGIRSQQKAMTQMTGDLAQTSARIQQIESEMAQKQAETEQIKVTARQAERKLSLEVNQLQATIADTQNLIAQAQSRLLKYQVRSPEDGMVSTLELDNIGEVVQPGQTLAEIVPADTPVVLSASVAPQEAGLIETGMPTQIKLDAFPYQEYGILSGSVSSISPDAKNNPQSGNTYQIEIALEQDYVTHEQRPVPLQIGQTAKVEIVVRQRRIIDLIFDPIRRLQTDELSL